MSIIKGTVEVTLNLSKSTCYFLRTGKCSLSVVRDFAMSAPGKISKNDLLYCPRLYQSMKNRKSKPVTIVPCQCGHGQVVTGQQRACIASQKGLQLSMRPAGEEVKAACQVCGGQVTFDGESGGNRIVTLKALVYRD